MSDLRSLGYTLTLPAPTNYPTEILIYNTSVNTPNNGGFCCLWTAPANTVWVRFEMWGSGGGGPGGCCCQQGWGGGGGSYTVKSVCSATLAGCQYTVCAAGSTPTSPACIGCGGNTSYVTGYGLSNFCATGGAGGDAKCWLFQSCYTCSTPNPYCCCSYGGDICIHGVQSSFTSNMWCAQYPQQQTMVAPATVSGPMYGPGGCMNGSANGNCTDWWPCAAFPGGGGFAAQAHGGNCWCGGWGAGGLVSITYG